MLHADADLPAEVAKSDSATLSLAPTTVRCICLRYAPAGELNWAEILNWVKLQTTDFDDVDLDGPAKSFAPKRREAERIDATSQLDLPKLIAKLPVKTNLEDYEKRKKAFASFDISGNGSLSLSECDSGLRNMLGAAKAVGSLAPAVKQAFHAAKDARTDACLVAGSSLSDGEEFRLFLVFTKKYCESREALEPSRPVSRVHRVRLP